MSTDGRSEAELRDEAVRHILAELVETPRNESTTILRLAEAYAWLTRPGQAHGTPGAA